MRTKNSIINSLVGILSYIILSLGPFVLSPFIASLGKGILGLQKTFMDTAALLGVVELGISFGIIYKLYKPIADNDKEKIAILLNFYKKAFLIISFIVLLLGIIIACMMPRIVPAHDVNVFSDSWFSGMFMLYVANILATYLFGHKRAMLVADQKNYLVNICRTSFQVLMYILQVISVCVFKSFELYVVSRLICTLLDSILIDVIYKKIYKDINLKTKSKLDKEEKTDLFKNLGALFYHKIGYQSLVSFSTLIITNKLGDAITGIYYPYTLITNGLMSITDQIFNRAMLASFGNLLVRAKKGEVYNIYKKIFFLNYIIYSFFSVSFFCLIWPFIRVWMGEKFLFPMSTILLLTINLYMWGMRQSITMVKNSAGLYRPDRYFSLFESALNMCMALLLVNKFGLNGVIMANILSSLFVPFWTQPYVVYKNVFNRSPAPYYKRYIAYTVITIVSGLITYYMCELCIATGLIAIIVKAFICLVIPNSINILVFYKTEEFQYLLGVLKNMFVHFKTKES